MRKEHSGARPLIHCITNPIAMTQSANAVLAVGGRPIMAEHPGEVHEITSTADALLINFGNISDVKMEAMKIAIRVAADRDIPVVIDVCGVACSGLRRRFFAELVRKGRPEVIKGNYSEILALYDDNYKGVGVDSEAGLSKEEVEKALLQLSREYGCIILATGKIDIIADNGTLTEIEGGCSQMSQITGTGCMLGAIISTFLTRDRTLDGVKNAVIFFGDCGKKAETGEGGGSFLMKLIDALGEHDEF